MSWFSKRKLTEGEKEVLKMEYIEKLKKKYIYDLSQTRKEELRKLYEEELSKIVLTEREKREIAYKVKENNKKVFEEDLKLIKKWDIFDFDNFITIYYFWEDEQYCKFTPYKKFPLINIYEHFIDTEKLKKTNNVPKIPGYIFINTAMHNSGKCYNMIYKRDYDYWEKYYELMSAPPSYDEIKN